MVALGTSLAVYAGVNNQETTQKKTECCDKTKCCPTQPELKNCYENYCD